MPLCFRSLFFCSRIYIHMQMQACASMCKHVCISMHGYTPLLHARHSCTGAALYGIASATISLVRGPPTPPPRIDPPPPPSMRDNGTLKVSLSGLGDGPEAATATRLPIHLTICCSSPADLPDLSRHASRKIAFSGLDWISQTRHSQRPLPGCGRPSIH